MASASGVALTSAAVPEALPRHDVACVVHVHSTHSDGTATVREIAASAAEAGADAVLLTDHDTVEARRRGEEAWHDRVLVLVGHEVTPERGHFLAFGLDREIPHAGRSEAEICAEVADRGGLGFPAHPFSRGSRVFSRKGRPHPWEHLDCSRYTGVELWSLGTDAAEAWSGVRDAVAFVRDPLEAIDHPPAHNVAAWDRLCQRRRTVAIGGLDAHQNGVRLAGRVFTPVRNASFFRLLQTHVLCERPLTGDVDSDATAVYAALRAGSCFLAVDALAPASGFGFWAEGERGLVSMGSEDRGGEWTLRAVLARSASLRLLRDGEVVQQAIGSELEVGGAGPGVYRVEALLERRGRARTWILSNPVYLRRARV